MAFPRVLERADASSPTQGDLTGLEARVRVDGKCLTRGEHRLRVQGVTYGPFVPNGEGEPFPSAGRSRTTWSGCGRTGSTRLRTYHLPPEWLLDLADERGMTIFLDIPWPKHVCFLQSAGPRTEARRRVRQAAAAGARASRASWPTASATRSRPTSSAGTARGASSDSSRSCGTWPSRPTRTGWSPTPATRPPSTSNSPSSTSRPSTSTCTTRRRSAATCSGCRTSSATRPLVLGELGMDTLRHGEAEQARFLAGHLREAALMGLAGAFVFSWTDDWHTGGYPDRGLGVRHHHRRPRPEGLLPRRAARSSSRSPADAAGGDAARVGGRLLVQRRRAPWTSASARCSPSIIRTTRSSSSTTARRTTRGRSSRGSRASWPSTRTNQRPECRPKRRAAGGHR